MEEKHREREASDDVNEKEMVVIEESDDLNEIEILEEKRREILEAPLPPTPIKCENNDSASSSSDQHEQHQPKDSIIDIKELEELMEFLGDHVDYNLKDIHVPPVHQCCIYRVPKDLRKINEAAYTPQVISIGPLHHGDKEFIEMEKQKLRYMLEFSKRVGAEKLKEFKRFIEDNEQHIRNYYRENSSLPSPKFVNMILHDAVFIIEVFLKDWLQDGTFDFFLHTPSMRLAINRDLQLLENQLPYIVLQTLFEQGAFHNVTNEKYPDHDPLLILSHNFFLISKPDVFSKPNYQIKHFTDLRRYFLLMNFCPEKEPGKMRDLPNATKLHSSGVKFKMGIKDSLEISCKDVKNAIRIPYLKSCELPIPWIKELELQIPRFEIYDNTKCLYRNMMALEQCHYPRETRICNFILLMDYLINTVKDVDLLVDEGIIFNSLGDNAAIAKMFNNFCLQIGANPSNSYNISRKLKEHYNNRWNHTMATFKTVYFSDIWKGTATVAAVILLVLTFVQTVFSIVK